MRKAIRLLDSLADASDALGLTELARDADINKATAHRLLTALTDGGFVRKDDKNRRYTLGLRLVQLGTHALERIGIPQLARPHLIGLMGETRQTVHLAILEGGAMVYIGKIEGLEGVTLRSRVGSTPPIHVTSGGKCLLAFLPLEEREALLAHMSLPRFTRNTITGHAEFRRHLEEVRRRGFAVDNEEHREGIRCVGAPVFDAHNRVAAAVSVAGPAFRFSRQAIPRMAECVIRCARAISASLGHGGLRQVQTPDTARRPIRAVIGS